MKINETDLRICLELADLVDNQSTQLIVLLNYLIPSGISVSQQDEKSQHKNKAKGMKILRARLYELERSRVRVKDQKTENKIGTGDRSERIRTYILHR